MKSKLRYVLGFAFALSGCFNNMSGLDEAGVSRSSQHTLDQDPLVSNLEIEGTLVSVYREATGVGLVADVGKPLLAAIGQNGIDQLIAHPSSSGLVKVNLSGYHVQLQIPQTRLVSSSGKLMNVIRLTPNRIDIMEGRIQDEAPAILMSSSQMPVVLFGGKIEGDAVDMMSLGFFDPIYQTSGFSPNSTNPLFGNYFPGNAPVGIVPDLIPVSSALKTIFSRVFRNPDHSLRAGVPTNFESFDTYPDRYFMAVYRSGGQIVETKAIYLSTNPSPSQDAITFCAKSFDDVDNFVFGSFSTGDQVLGGDPRSCTCVDPLYSTSASLPVPSNLIAGDPCSPANAKVPAINAALSANPAPPRTGVFLGYATTLSGISVVPK
ncbi:MAG: hypothetical protein JST04_16265 [Bdellovibrionales bacterium]|nr:hypothetical protein [Bdellovibrionales bacterium]